MCPRVPDSDVCHTVFVHVLHEVKLMLNTICK